MTIEYGTGSAVFFLENGFLPNSRTSFTDQHAIYVLDGFLPCRIQTFHQVITMDTVLNDGLDFDQRRLKRFRHPNIGDQNTFTNRIDGRSLADDEMNPSDHTGNGQHQRGGRKKSEEREPIPPLTGGSNKNSPYRQK